MILFLLLVTKTKNNNKLPIWLGFILKT